MTVTNFGELKTAMEDELRHDNLTATQIPRFIRQGEQRLYQKLRVRFMETIATIATTASQQTDALPTRFRQARSLYVSGSPNVRLEYRTSIEFWGVYASDTNGKPVVFTIEGENFVWGPTPDAAYNIKVLYYQEPEALSEASDTNGVFTLDFQLLMYASLIASAPFLKNDARLLVWAQLYEQCLEDVMAADSLDRYSGDVRVQERVGQQT